MVYRIGRPLQCKPIKLVITLFIYYSFYMSKKIGDLGFIVIDCNDIERISLFWSQILGLKIAETSLPYIDLDKSSSEAPTVCFQKVPEPKTTKNRVHLDIYVADLQVATKNIEVIGGKFMLEHSEGKFKWRVMADPEGNEFCIVERRLEQIS